VIGRSGRREGRFELEILVMVWVGGKGLTYSTTVLTAPARPPLKAVNSELAGDDEAG
jgi:hypothetical protein